MDFNTQLNNMLADNNILANKTMEHKEWEYYNVVFQKTNKGLYITEPNHPMLNLIKSSWNVVENKIVLTRFEFENVRELVRLEQGNVILKSA